MHFRPIHVALLLGALACRAAPPAALEAPAEIEPVLGVSELPRAWDSSPPSAFEGVVEGLASEPFRWTDPDRRALVAALEHPGPRALRAAVLLARSGTAVEPLLRHLERRRPPTDRADDAASVVAAAALAEHPAAVERLAALASGPRPHPDLEVRVECARSALALGDTSVLPLLVGVLRIDTWDGQNDVRDYTPSATTAWVRQRAAEALAEHLGLEDRYRADASIEDRQRVAKELADLLGVALPLR